VFIVYSRASIGDWDRGMRKGERRGERKREMEMEMR
jgi:hypothetical protein